MIWHSSDVESVLNELSVDKNNGLPNGVAYERLDKYGKNQTAELKPVSFLRRFLTQINKKSVYALTVISLICVVFSSIYGNNDYSYLLIIAFAVLNALITAAILYSCDRASYVQKAASIPTCTVLREGVQRTIPANELAIGDIVILEEGNYIPADVRLIETNAFRCNELALTGEIVPVDKDAEAILEDIVPCTGRTNMAYSGCNVTHGYAKAVVVETGVNTEIYKLASVSDKRLAAVSGIEKKLSFIARVLNVAVVILCAIAFIIGMILTNNSSEHFAQRTVNTLLNSVALGIAAIPECIPYITILVTALGAVRLIKHGIIVKNTAALEKTAKTTVLCADKTGVFTKNRMKLNSVFNGEELKKPTDGKLDAKSSMIIRLAVACSMLENDNTESAIEDACITYGGMSKEEIGNAYPRLAYIPFDSDRRMMTSINIIDGKPFAVIKGAPEAIIEKCAGLDKEAVTETCDKLAKSAYRLICVAIKPLDEIPANPDPESIECDLKFLGIICLEDPPRSEASVDIEFCRNNGVNVIMITGDNLSTALAVAEDIGIIASENEAITGAELDEIDDDELKKVIGNYKVFARISPAQKLRIVNTLKSNGETVTVTGGGLDDADVLSVSDVGMAIGQNVNDVAKGNADVIINKNNFSLITSVFRECYGLFDNIKKTVCYMLSSNSSEILIYLCCMLIFKMPPLLAVQLLFINLLTDSLPAISLTVQPADRHRYSNNLRIIKAKLFDANTVLGIILESVILTGCGIAAFAIGRTYGDGDGIAYTLTFLTVILSQAFHLFNFVSDDSVIYTRYKRNKFAILSALATVLITVILCATPAGGFLGLTPLNSDQILTGFALSLIIIPFCEIIKLVKNRRFIFKKDAV
ncbi:MAG: cation-transporting P-type ATPase [Clostridia bacterium]|nr:cation-transporting P-type ATPase [Clostridia bacterium]